MLWARQTERKQTFRKREAFIFKEPIKLFKTINVNATYQHQYEVFVSKSLIYSSHSTYTHGVALLMSVHHRRGKCSSLVDLPWEPGIHCPCNGLERQHLPAELVSVLTGGK